MSLAVLLVSLSLLWAATGHAATVAIVRPSSSTPPSSETVSRLHGELLSVGLEVIVVERVAERTQTRTTFRAWMQELMVQGDVDAVIDVIGDTGPIAVDVWVAKGASRRLQVARVTVDPNTKNAAERLSIRAIEVLRSGFLENDVAARARRRHPASTPAVAAQGRRSDPVPAAAAEARRDQAPAAVRAGRIGLVAGTAVIASLDGVGPAIMPLAGLDWDATPIFVTRAVLAGLGSHPSVATKAGTARVDQRYATLGGRYRLLPDRWLTPFVALSTGVLQTSVEGEADAPRLGHAVDQWSFLLDGCAGTELRLPASLYLTLAAHAHLAAPHVAIHIADEIAATTGHPNIGLTLAVGTWL